MNAIIKNNASVACEWAKNLAEDWEFRLIKRDFIVTLGKMLQSVQHNETETEEYYLRSANLRWGGVDITDVRRMWFAPQEKKKLALQYGDLLVSEGGDAGRTSFWQNELSNCYIQNAINRVRARKKDSTRFLYYWLHLIKSIGYIDAVVSRITIAHLTAEKLERIPFIKPPIPVQHRITSYLDKSCAAIDKAIEAKQKQLEILDALRKSIIHKAVTRGLDDSVELKDSGVEWLGRIPKHWNCEHLKRVCSRIQTGSTPPTANTEYYVDGTIPWYAPGCYDGGIYLQEPAKEINEIAYFNNKLRLYPAHSIFIVGIGATIGKVAMTRVEASCNQQITALVCNSDVYAKYLTYHLKIFESIIPRIAQFTTLPIIDQNKIGYLQIALPPIKEQEQIAEFLDDKVAMNDRLENNLVKQISTLEQYRKSLIHECVTGKRRITDEDVQNQL